MSRLSPRVTAALGRLLGDVVWSLLRLRRAVVMENLAAALPHLSPLERCRTAREVYRHLGRVALEYFQLRQLTPERARCLIGDENLERFRALLSRGRGALVLSAHLGNWDLLACSAAVCGIPVNVITRRIKNRSLDRFWTSRRRRCGVRLLPASGSARNVMRALRRNEVVVFVLDQHAPGGEVVPFLGRPAATSRSLARVARATGAPVVPVFMPRLGSEYASQVLDTVEVGETKCDSLDDDSLDDVRLSTTRYSAIIEQVVREYPTQWFWLHRRWKVVVNPLDP